MKKVIFVFLAVIAGLVLVDFGISSIIYQNMFGGKVKSEFLFTTDYFGDTFIQTPIDISTGVKSILKCYLYTPFSDEARTSVKGLVVIAPSSLGGQNRYMPHVNEFIKAGYSVFAYDGKGYDESSGSSRGGVGQSVADLVLALERISTIDELSPYPLLIYGDELGAFAALTLMSEYKQISGVVSVSGFAENQSYIIDSAFNYVSYPAYGLYPAIKIKEFSLYQLDSFKTPADGIANSSANIFFAHGRFNPNIRDVNYDNFVKKYSQSEFVNFKQYPDLKMRLDYSRSALSNIRSTLDQIESERSEYKRAKDVPPEIQEKWRMLYQDAYADINKDFLADVIMFFDNSLVKNEPAKRRIEPPEPENGDETETEGEPENDEQSKSEEQPAQDETPEPPEQTEQLEQQDATPSGVEQQDQQEPEPA